MGAIVTLDVYSGQPNPSWYLDDEKLDQLRSQTGGATGTRLGSLPVLGYRGFIVRPVESEHAPAPPMHGLLESVAGSGDGVIVGIPPAEQFLLSTAGPQVDAELRQHVEQSISAGGHAEIVEAAKAPPPVKCPACHAADAPVYNPGFWNVPTRQPYNNCYNYANDQATNTFAQPGRATGHMYTQLTCASVQPAAVSDGLRACPNFAGTLGPGHGWYVALVIWPGRDYHWYRQDKVGCWSHKPGQTAARNTDNSGKSIIDPQHCDRGPYTSFCTYMITTRKVRIR